MAASLCPGNSLRPGIDAGRQHAVLVIDHDRPVGSHRPGGTDPQLVALGLQPGADLGGNARLDRQVTRVHRVRER